MASPAAVLSILVTANTSNATRGLVRLNTQLGATESSANKALGAVKTMAKGAAIGTGIGLGYAVKKAADFEQQLDSLGSVSGATGREMEKFRKQAMKAGADTKFSALDAAKAQTELAKGGASVAQIAKGGLKSALALAAAGELDLALAAETSANAMNLFALEGKDAMKVADQLATAANATTADVEDFAVALKMGGSVAKMAGMSFSETVLSLEALAKIGIRNSDAGTSLKTAIIQLLKPTEKQAALTDKLNLSFVDQQGNFKSMAAISEMLRNKLGGMTAAQRTATLATLAGTDGVRTLSALYDAGPKKLDKWKAGLEKSGTAAKVAAEKQDNLKGKLENLQGSIETVAIAIGSKMLPALTDAATKVTDIINDPKLTASEKLDKLSAMMGKAIAAGIPKVAKAAAAGGAAAANAFVTAFVSSGIWAKLLIGGWLLKRFGGLPAFTAAGATAGNAFGTGMATGVGVGAKAKLAGVFAGLRKLGGRLLLLDVGINLIDSKGNPIAAAINTAHDITFGVVPKVELPSGSERQAAELGKAADEIERLSKRRDWGGLTRLSANLQADAEDARHFKNEKLADAFDKLAGAAQRSGVKGDAATHKWSDAITGMVRDSKGKLGGMRTNVQFNTELIRKALKDKSGEGARALQHNLGDVLRTVRTTMSRSGKVTAGGMDLMRALFVNELRFYGLSAKAAIAGANLRTGEVPGGFRRQDFVTPQRGAYITGGKPSGDSVPSLLERGEYVLNRNAVSKVGKKNLDRINFGIAPRFQQGGTVPRIHVAGTDSPLRSSVQGALDKTRSAANHKLSIQVGPGPPGGATFGPKGIGTYSGLPMANWVIQALQYAARKGVSPSPTSGYRSHAHNVAQGRNYYSEHEGTQYPHGAVDFGSYTTGLAEKMSVVAATAGFKYPLLAPIGFRDDGHASGTGHQLGGIVGFQNGGGVKASAAAGGVSAELRRLISMAAKKYGIPARILAGLIKVESGWDPNAVSPKGAFGLTQFMPSTATGYGVLHGSSHAAMASQILGAAHYLKDLGYSSDRRKALGAYNGGPGNPQYDYADDVIAASGMYRGIYAKAGGKMTEGSSKWDWVKMGNHARGVFLRGKAKQKMVDAFTFAKLKYTQKIDWGRTKHQLGDKTALERYPRKATTRNLKPYGGTGNAGILDAFMGAAEDRLNLSAALAALTETPLDDIASAADAVHTWEQWLGVAQLNNIPGGITTAAQNLKSARDNLATLTAVDTSATDAATAERVSLVEQLLREANLRTSVSQAQYGVLKNYGGSFADGGVVPGPLGSPRVIVAHGGETVSPVGAGGVQVIVNGDISNVPRGKKAIEVRDIRGHHRALPGRGGG